MSDPSFFDWECFYHVEDFTYCLSRVWAILLVIYLTNAMLFGILAFVIYYLRRKVKRKYSDQAAHIRGQYERMT